MNYLGFIGSAKNIYSDCDAWIVYNSVVGSAMIRFELLNERFSYIEIINIYIYFQAFCLRYEIGISIDILLKYKYLILNS